MTQRREFVVSLPVEPDREGDQAAIDLANTIVYGAGLYGDQVKVRKADGEQWFGTDVAAWRG